MKRYRGVIRNGSLDCMIIWQSHYYYTKEEAAKAAERKLSKIDDNDGLIYSDVLDRYTMEENARLVKGMFR